MNYLPTFEECNAIEREDRTPLEAFVWEHEPSDQVSLDEFRKLLGAVIEAERAQVETFRKDAERYRWMRTFAGRDDEFPILVNPKNPDHLDALIDVEMAQVPK